jgi:hypothetical protein
MATSAISILSTTGLAFASPTLDTVLLKRGRMIAGIIPDVVIEERGRDEIEITRHPIQNGSPVSDHMFKQPSELVMRIGFTDSGKGLLSAFTEPTLDARYSEFLHLQEVGLPFSIVTGKRNYDNMLLKSVGVVTNVDTENSLILECVFEQVFIVNVTATTSLPPMSQQLNPQKTAAATNAGTKQAVKVNAAIPGVG